MDKFVTKTQMQTILDNRPKGVSMDEVISGFRNNGYKVEGIDQAPTPPEPSLGQKLMERGKTVVKEVTGQPASQILAGADKTSGTDIAGAGAEALLRTAQAPIRVAGAIGGAIGDVVGAGMQATGITEPIGKVLAPVVQSSPVQKAMETFKSLPQDTQDVLGAILNTANIPLAGAGASLVKQGAEAGIKTTGKAVKQGAESLAPVISKVTPTSESIMQRVARIPKGEQAKFEKITGKSVGQFLDETGNYGTPDKIIERLYNDFTKSKQTADDALAQIQGTYKSAPVSTALSELKGKVARTSSPGAPDADLVRVTELVAKEKSQGLTMTEINEVKRIYERRVRLDYLKSNVAEDVTRANNVDNALRTWQFAEAEKAGLTNLPEINKFTQANKQLMDALGKEQAGIGGNNALGLTDAILLAGGSPESIASLITKKVFSDKGIQSYVAKKISKTPIKTGVPEANFSKPTPPQSPKKLLPVSSSKSITPKKKVNSTPVDKLSQEARNYKTAEELKNAGVIIDDKGIATVYRGGNVSEATLKDLRYNDYLSSVKTGKDSTGNSGASEYGKNIVTLKIPAKDLKVENGEIKFIGESKSISGGTKYPKEIYKAYNDYVGSNYTAKEIDVMKPSEVADYASGGLEGGRDEFTQLTDIWNKAHKK